MASKLGFDTSRFADDGAAEAGLREQVRQMQANEHFARVGQQVYPHLSEWQNWQKQQQAAAAAQQAQQNKWWNPPEWNPEWLNMVDRDPTTGQFVPKVGFAPDVASKIEAYRNHRENLINGLAKDPIEFLKPGLEPLIKQMAQQLVQEQLQGFQAETGIKQTLEKNSHWLYEHDEGGAAKLAPNGQKVLSLPGRIMQQHAQRIESFLTSQGVRQFNHEQVFAQALELTRGTLAQMQAEQLKTQTPAAPATPAAQPAAPGVNRLQNLGTNAGANGTGVPRPAKKSLGQMMNAALDAKGITQLS
jgi:hypothetical protein